MNPDLPPTTVSHRTWNIDAPARTVWASDYRTLRDFRVFEIVNSMRLNLTLDGFRALATLGSIALLLVGTFGFVSGMSVLRDGPLRNDSAGVLSWGFLAILYAAAALVLSEIISSRRLAVSGTPHLELFRALELPYTQVVLRYGVVPLLRRAALLWYSAAVFFIIFFEPTPHYSSIVAASAAILALASFACLYAILRFAAAPPRRVNLGWPFCLLTLGLGVGVGAVTGFLLSRMEPGQLPTDYGGYLWLGGMLALAASAATILLCIRRWNALAYRKILLASSRRDTRPRPTVSTFLTFVFTDLFSSRQGSIVSTFILAWIAVVGFLLGARGILPLSTTLTGDELQRSLVGMTVLLSLGITEPMLHRIGPTAKLFHYRFAWENGDSSMVIVGRLIGAYFLMGGMVGAFLFCSAFLAFGIFVPATITVGFIVIAAGVIGESLSRPPTSTDGTKANDLMDALFTLLLVSPCSLVLVLGPDYSNLLLLGYSVFLTLGVAACLRTRLLKLRSKLTL